MNKPTLILMVGICASGKSTQAKVLGEQYNAKIVSSDALRLELYGSVTDQDNNHEVFNELNRRVRDSLSNGINTIIDATNISIKSRRSLLKNVEKIDCHKIAYIMAKPVEQCLEDNIYRDNPVPHHVITKMYMNFQIPFMEEGFDKIVIHKFNNVKKSDVDCLKEMEGFDQKTPHHKYNLLRHCLKADVHFGLTTLNLDMGCTLHDYSKLHTQTFDGQGNAHYYQHENVGAYKILTEVDLGLNTTELLDCLFLINYHMMPFQWKQQKTHDKYKKLFGEEKYQLLIDFNKADRLASGTDNLIKLFTY